MSNWFEENATKSIIIYTFLVMAVTWGAFKFIFYDNKIESANIRVEQYVAKIDVLEAEIRQLRAENDKVLKWLENNPNTIPYLEKQIAKKDEEIAELKNKSFITMHAEGLIYAPGEKPYDYINSLRKGDSFIDPKTKIKIELTNIAPDNVADIMLAIPGKPVEDLKNVRVGTSWIFREENLKKYKLILTQLNWYAGKAEFRVIEIPKSMQ
jgi:hypothetical protein